jgi:beta-glucosidase
VNFDDHEDAVLVDATRESGDAVAPAADGTARLVFREVDLSGANAVVAEVARTPEGTALLELHAGGRLLAVMRVPSTGDRYNWTTVKADLAGPLDGVHELTVVLTGELRLRTLDFTS